MYSKCDSQCFSGHRPPSCCATPYVPGITCSITSLQIEVSEPTSFVNTQNFALSWLIVWYMTGAASVVLFMEGNIAYHTHSCGADGGGNGGGGSGSHVPSRLLLIPTVVPMYGSCLRGMLLQQKGARYNSDVIGFREELFRFKRSTVYTPLGPQSRFV